MHSLPIPKDVTSMAVQPNLLDYEAACTDFSWQAVRAALDGLPDGNGLNIAHEAVDRNANGPLRDRVAFRFLGKDGTITDLTYGALQQGSNRFANLLRRLRIAKGDRKSVV